MTTGIKGTRQHEGRDNNTTVGKLFTTHATASSGGPAVDHALQAKGKEERRIKRADACDDRLAGQRGKVKSAEAEQEHRRRRRRRRHRHSHTHTRRSDSEDKFCRSHLLHFVWSRGTAQAGRRRRAKRRSSGNSRGHRQTRGSRYGVRTGKEWPRGTAAAAESLHQKMVAVRGAGARGRACGAQSFACNDAGHLIPWM